MTDDRKPRGRGEPKERMVFGLHQICWVCRGKGTVPKKKEVCGMCGGTGVYVKEPPYERK